MRPQVASIELLRRTVEPVQLRQMPLSLPTVVETQLSFGKLALPMMNGIQMVALDQIEYLRADSNYTIFHLFQGKSIMVSKPLNRIESLLSSRIEFLRIHRSHVINLNYLQRYVRGKSGWVEMMSGAELEVGLSRKAELISILQQHFGWDPGE